MRCRYICSNCIFEIICKILSKLYISDVYCTYTCRILSIMAACVCVCVGPCVCVYQYNAFQTGATFSPSLMYVGHFGLSLD